MKNILNFFKQRDKQLHILCCFISAIIHPWLSCGLAIGKEYGDSCCKNNKWDIKDVIADCIGLALGTIVHLLIFEL